MNKTTKILAVTGVGVGVGVATAKFLKTEKGQEVKELVKQKAVEIINELESLTKEEDAVEAKPQTSPKIFLLDSIKEREEEKERLVEIIEEMTLEDDLDKSE